MTKKYVLISFLFALNLILCPNLAQANSCKNIFRKLDKSRLYSPLQSEIIDLLSVSDSRPPVFTSESHSLFWGDDNIEIKVLKPQKNGTHLNRIAYLLHKSSLDGIRVGLVTKGDPNAYGGFFAHLNLFALHRIEHAAPAVIHELKHVVQDIEAKKGLLSIFSGAVPSYLAEGSFANPDVGWNMLEFTAHPENIYLASNKTDRKAYTEMYLNYILGDSLKPLLKVVENFEKNPGGFTISTVADTGITFTGGSKTDWKKNSILSLRLAYANGKTFIELFIKAPGFNSQNNVLNMRLFFPASDPASFLSKLVSGAKRGRKIFFSSKRWVQTLERIKERVEKTVLAQTELKRLSQNILSEIEQGKTGEDSSLELLVFVRDLDSTHENPLD